MAAEIGLERHVKHLDEHFAHIMPQPFLENIYQELAVLFAADRAIGDEVAFLGIEQALTAGLIAPSWLAMSIVSALARSTIGMNCTHFACISSRKKR